MTDHDHDHDLDDHDLGWALDRTHLLPSGVSRRAALGLFAGAAGVGALTMLPSSASAATTPKTPTETAGPYPADGSNGPDVLDMSGVVRRDIRPSFGKYSGKARGIPLTIRLKFVHAATSRPYSGVAVYLWHCDHLGRYSLYSDGVTNRNYLRGIQVAGDHGRLSFLSTYPACYSGRWPHIHYEVYPNKADAHTASNRLLTSQIAMPKKQSRAVYATSKYRGSSSNLSNVSLATDNVFSDGWSRELADVTGNVHKGFTARLTVAI